MEDKYKAFGNKPKRKGRGKEKKLKQRNKSAEGKNLHSAIDNRSYLNSDIDIGL